MFESMRNSIQKSWFLLKKNWKPWPEGEEGLKVRDHRQMVGGMWDEIGEFQFDFLRNQGLEPSNVLLDIGCGSFRAGKWFIEYLEPGNYLGIDKQNELVEQGKKNEISDEIWNNKTPEIIVSDAFEFHRFQKKPDYAIAQSLFTHLSIQDIKICLINLAKFAPAHCKLYATFFESDKKVMNILSSHSSRRFEYTSKQMADLGKNCSWEMQYIGDWNHPRNQKLVIYYKK